MGITHKAAIPGGQALQAAGLPCLYLFFISGFLTCFSWDKNPSSSLFHNNFKLGIKGQLKGINRQQKSSKKNNNQAFKIQQAALQKAASKESLENRRDKEQLKAARRTRGSHFPHEKGVPGEGGGAPVGSLFSWLRFAQSPGPCSSQLQEGGPGSTSVRKKSL